MMQRLIFSLLLLGSLTACEQEIDIDLNSTDPKLVIEALLDDSGKGAWVKLTQTVNFSDTFGNPVQSGALVVLVRLSNNSRDTLQQLPDSAYILPNYVPLYGEEYAFEVTHQGNFYRATARMPQPIPIDSLVIDPFFGPGGLPGNPVDTTNQRNALLYAFYNDPPAASNYYQIQAFQNDTVTDNLFLYNDEVNSGLFQVSPVFVQTYINGRIRVELHHIDQAVFRYLTNLNTNIGQSSASPANPISNFSGGALGYFKLFANTSAEFQLVEPLGP
jgi:hypothetical protein